MAKLEDHIDILLRSVEDYFTPRLFTVLACEQQHPQRGTVYKINLSQIYPEPRLTFLEQTIDGCAKLLVGPEVKTPFQGNRNTIVDV